MDAVIAIVMRSLGQIDILVNCAGIVEIGPALQVDKHRFETVRETHVSGSYLCAQAAARAMVARGAGGKIINIGSMYSLFGSPIAGGYVTAKMAILGLTRTLAVDFAGHNIGEKIRRLTPAKRWSGAPDRASLARGAQDVLQEGEEFVG